MHQLSSYKAWQLIQELLLIAGLLDLPLKEEALHQIADATGTSKLNPTVADFTEALRETVPYKGIPPTVIFEVETGGSKEQILGIQAARSLSKEFIPVGNCIIVAS